MAWEAGKCLSLDDFTDGTSNTIMAVEVRGSQIHWTEPVDLDGTAPLKINARRGLSIGSHHPGDGSAGLDVAWASGDKPVTMRIALDRSSFNSPQVS